MTEIDAPAASAYTDGTNPIDYAIKTAATHIDITQTIAAGRTTNPNSFPAWGNKPLTPEATASRIVAALLNAGWTPPTDEQIREARTRVHAKRRHLITELEAGRVPPEIIETLGYEPDAAECRRMADTIRETLPESDPRA